MILASASPRRAAILECLGIPYTVRPAGIEESGVGGESPEEQALRLAVEKAMAVASLHSDQWVLAGDTLVTIEGAVLGKPTNLQNSVDMLLRLQARTHHVVSALALVPPRGSLSGVEVLKGVRVTAVSFRPFERKTAVAYARTGEARDKAGGYAIQGRGAALVDRVEGDYTGVVGLPVSLLLELLEQADRPYRFPD